MKLKTYWICYVCIGAFVDVYFAFATGQYQYILLGIVLGVYAYMLIKKNMVPQKEADKMFQFYMDHLKDKKPTPDQLGNEYLAVFYGNGKPVAIVGRNGNQLIYYLYANGKRGAVSKLPIKADTPVMSMHTYKESDIRFSIAQGFHETGNYIYQQNILAFGEKIIVWKEKETYLWLDSVLLNENLTRAAKNSAALSKRFNSYNDRFMLVDDVRFDYSGTGPINGNEAVVASHTLGGAMMAENNAMRNASQKFLDKDEAVAIKNWLINNLR